LYINPITEKTGRGKEAFEAFALHIWGEGVFFKSKGGGIHKAKRDSNLAKKMRAKMVRSVK
jgi:hypothetical protein